MFTEKEIEYLTGQRLGRLATVTRGGRPHVVPTGFRLDDARTAIEIGGHNAARSPARMTAHRDGQLAPMMDSSRRAGPAPIPQEMT